MVIIHPLPPAGLAMLDQRTQQTLTSIRACIHSPLVSTLYGLHYMASQTHTHTYTATPSTPLLLAHNMTVLGKHSKLFLCGHVIKKPFPDIWIPAD